jgi:hypothetical protein
MKAFKNKGESLSSEEMVACFGENWKDKEVKEKKINKEKFTNILLAK